MFVLSRIRFVLTVAVLNSIRRPLGFADYFIRVRPPCIAFSCLYAIVGLLAFSQYCFLEVMQQVTFPVGIIAPFVHFNINLNVPRSMTGQAPVLYAIAAVLTYAVSRCISGFVGVCPFNLFARTGGGIDAEFAKTVGD